MFKRTKMEKILVENLEKINNILARNNVLELVELLGDKKKLFVRNLITGIFKGIGIGMGVTVITAILIILLQKIVALNIPVIGEFISDIVDIVQNSR